MNSEWKLHVKPSVCQKFGSLCCEIQIPSDPKQDQQNTIQTLSYFNDDGNGIISKIMYFQILIYYICTEYIKPLPFLLTFYWIYLKENKNDMLWGPL